MALPTERFFFFTSSTREAISTTTNTTDTPEELEGDGLIAGDRYRSNVQEKALGR